MNNWRYSLFIVVTSLFGLVIIIRLYYLQVVRNQYYRVLAEQEHTFSRKLTPQRGLIYSADNFPLVLNRPAYLLFAEPPKIKEPDRTAALLAKVLNESFPATAGEPPTYSANSLKEKLGLDLYWVSLAKRLSPEVREKIERMNLAGIGFEEESVRFYPEGKGASYLLGFVGYNEAGEEQGYYGLEGFYDGELRGRYGEVFEERAASGKPIVGGDYRRRSPTNGATLVLTINRDVQHLLEERLAAAVGKYGAKSAAAVVMNPENGAIFGLVSYPNYDPARYEEVFQVRGDKKEDAPPSLLDFANPVISDAYEPGSVLKALTMSAALEEKVVKPQTTFDDLGPLTISGYTVDNWDKKHHGRQTMIELLQKSNNIGAATVGRWLGSKVLHDYFQKFGLGRMTGVDLEGESLGILKKEDTWREIDLATAAFGQGVSVTPLQLVRAFAVIANGGYLVKPYVVAEIRDERGTLTLKTGGRERILSAETAQVMAEMLTAAAEGGEAKFAILKSHRIAGKTGTAQIPIGGKYDPTKTNATFVGFFTNQPKFVMLIRVSQPTSSIYAAETAAPLWMDIARDLSIIFQATPDR